MDKSRADCAEDEGILQVQDLQVYYGESTHSRRIDDDRTRGLVRRRAKRHGKETLCNTIAGLKSARSGGIHIRGRETSRLEPHIIQRLGVGYVPQGTAPLAEPLGRRDFAPQRHRRAGCAWTVERVYEIFPRLSERRTNGGANCPAASNKCWRSAARFSAIRAS